MHPDQPPKSAVKKSRSALIIQLIVLFCAMGFMLYQGAVFFLDRQDAPTRPAAKRPLKSNPDSLLPALNHYKRKVLTPCPIAKPKWCTPLTPGFAYKLPNSDKYHFQWLFKSDISPEIADKYYRSKLAKFSDNKIRERKRSAGKNLQRHILLVKASKSTLLVVLQENIKTGKVTRIKITEIRQANPGDLAPQKSKPYRRPLLPI